MREILPTVEVWRGDAAVRQIPVDDRSLWGIEVSGVDGAATTLTGFLEQSFTDGFLVLHRGRIASERYFNSMDARTLHLSQSLAKSFVGALTGILAARGDIDVAAPLTDTVPELANTAYRGATLRHVLDMTSGVRFSEDYEDPRSDMGRADVASGWKPIPAGDAPESWPSTMVELILSLKAHDSEHGSRFSYRSIETDVLALVLERATGRQLARLLSEEFWQKLGMEESANMTVDAAGFALADGGLNACLRDYGRFGEMLLQGGAGIVPTAWIEATRNADHAIFGAPYDAVLPRGAYRNQFWIDDPQRRNIVARGVFGQLIFVDFTHQVVVVKLSSWPQFVNPAWTRATLAAVRRIGEALTRSG